MVTTITVEQRGVLATIDADQPMTTYMIMIGIISGLDIINL